MATGHEDEQEDGKCDKLTRPADVVLQVTRLAALMKP
jgi:hypothetical protein